MITQKIIDTHIHIWDFEKARYNWLDGDTSILNRTYALAELEEERKAAGITGGLLVQAANNFQDTDWMLQVAAGTDWIKGVVGWLPLTDTSMTVKALESYKVNPCFKGVRHLIHNEADDEWLLQKAVIQSLKALAEANLSYDIVGVKTGHIRTALKLAEKLPELRMVFDHLNQPPIAGAQRFGEWGELMKAAAAHPQLYVKISGLGTTAAKGEAWTDAHIEPYIAFVLEHFGEDRCFCGGDWPVSLLAGTYTATWHIYKSILEKLLDKRGQERVFYSNACRFYQI